MLREGFPPTHLLTLPVQETASPHPQGWYFVRRLMSHETVQPAPILPPEPRRSTFRAWTRDLLLAFGVSAFIIIFLYQPVRVEGTSMLPGLEDSDRLFIDKLAFRIGEIHRGDVVVFRYPRDETQSYIKRIIALPGDTVRIDHGLLYVNGHEVAEPYVPTRFFDDRSMPQQQVPAQHYFVMGDHRNISADSRVFGPIDRTLVYGKAAFVYWPVDQAGVVR